MLCVLALFGGLRASVGAELTGLVRDNQGNGLSNLSVGAHIYSEIDFFAIWTVTDDTGRFTLSGEPGLWYVGVETTPLYARGYFALSGPALNLTGQATVRLTTRKLDFTHRIAGRLLDEVSRPLAGYYFNASIEENNLYFETNVTTGADGAFLIPAAPAVWSLCCLNPPAATVVRVFPDRAVEVMEAEPERRVTFVAPKVTAIISVTASNLGLWDVVVSTEAFGETYRLTQTVSPSGFPVAFQVFDGVWTVSATNTRPYRSYSAQQFTAPAPVSIAVTNGAVAVAMDGILATNPTRQVQWVRTFTRSGAAVSNVYVYASSVVANASAQPVLLATETPGIHALILEEGPWRIYALMDAYPGYVRWSAEREVIVRSNVAPAELNLVFPDPDSGPRISGTVRCAAGAGVAGQTVWLHTLDSSTHLGIYLKTDALGGFGTNVFPGRWEAVIYNPCRVDSAVVVSNQDVQLDLEVCLPVGATPIPVTVSLLDEAGTALPDAWVRLTSGPDLSETNSASQSVNFSLRPGLWSVFVSPWYLHGSDLHTLLPSQTWHLPTGIAETNLVLVTRLATSRIEGRLRDEQGRLLTSGYAAAWTSVNGTNFVVRGYVRSGYFSLNVSPGEWEVRASVSAIPSIGVPGDFPGIVFPGRPGESAYSTPASRLLQVSNSVAKCDFVVTNLPSPANVTIVATVLQDNGQIVSNSVVSVYQPDTTLSRGGRPNADGSMTFVVPGGKFILNAYQKTDTSLDATLLWPSLTFDATAPSNHIVLVVRSTPRRISGSVSSALAIGLNPYVSAATVVNGTNYFSVTCADHSGRYSLPVFPGQWSVQIDGYLPNAFGLQSLPPREVTAPPDGPIASVDFVVTPMSGDFRLARLLNPVPLPNGGSRIELRGQANLGWRIERSENLRDWTFVGLRPAANGALVIEEPPEPSRRAAFYRAVWVR